MEKCATGNDVIGSEVIGSDVTGSDVSHVNGSDGSHATGSDVIFPALFFLTRLVVQNVPLLFFIRSTASDYSFRILWLFV